jgi:tetratricopeptide (TPR) repeat protein
MANATGSIDAIFAGMPRSAAWPPDADEPPPTAPTLFDRSPDMPGQGQLIEPAPGAAATAVQVAAPAAVVPAPGPLTLGLWADDVPEEPGARDLPEPARELEAGRTALVAGRFDEAILRFGLALRLAPSLAPAVLEATAGSRASGLLMVRGDAYRLAGHEDEAKEAYLAAARGGLPERRRRSRTRPARTEPAVVAEGEAAAAAVSPPEAAPRATEAIDPTAETAANDARPVAQALDEATGLDDEAEHIDPSAATSGNPPA